MVIYTDLIVNSFSIFFAREDLLKSSKFIVFTRKHDLNLQKTVQDGQKEGEAVV